MKLDNTSICVFFWYVQAFLKSMKTGVVVYQLTFCFVLCKLSCIKNVSNTPFYLFIYLFVCLFVCFEMWPFLDKGCTFIPILGLHRPVFLETHSNSKVHKHLDKNSSSVILLNMFNIDTNMYSVSSQRINLDFSWLISVSLN